MTRPNREIANKLWCLGALLTFLCFAQTSLAAPRVIRAQNMTIAPGTTNRMLIVMEGSGEESALGFSLSYDTSLLTFVSVVAGMDATNVAAEFTANTSQTTTAGFLGIGLQLDIFSGTTFPAGTNILAEVYFRAAPEITSASTPVTFVDQPIAPEVSNPVADVLPTSFVGATVSIQCDYILSTNAAYFPAAASASSANLSATCPWAVISTNAWVTISLTTNQNGTATVSFNVPANPGFSSRSGVITIAEQAFAITQEGNGCIYELSSTNAVYSSDAITNSVNIITSNTCPWSVSNTDSWITILSGNSGSGNGTVTYALGANPSLTPRSGAVSIQDKIFNVAQQGVTCTYTLFRSNDTHTAAGHTNSFAVTVSSPCPWFVDNTNSWITILAGAGGEGPGEVTYSVTPNLSTSDRIGALVIGNQIFTVQQQGVVCAYTLLSTNAVHTAATETNVIGVTAGQPCSWSVTNTNSWITILSGDNGTGVGEITYSVSPNAVVSGRNGTLVIGGEIFSVTQQGISCSYSLSPTDRTHDSGSVSNFFTVSAASGCLWSVVNTNPWLTVVGGSGSGTNTVGYIVDANPLPIERIGFLSVQDVTLIITQQPGCVFTFSPSNPVHSSLASTGIVSVTAGAACAWTATTASDWITISDASGTGNGNFSYIVSENFNAASRTGSVMVAGETLPVTQSGYSGKFAFQSINVGLLGEISLCITGGPAGTWELQTSPNLSEWSKIASLTNTTGRVDYVSPSTVPTNLYYRAVLP